MIFTVISIVVLGIAGLTMLAITEKPVIAVAPFGALVSMILVPQGIGIIVAFLLTLAGTVVFVIGSERRHENAAAVIYAVIVPVMLLVR